jgi:hypothetical protein
VTSPYDARGFDWENAGRELGETMGAYSAIVVIGADPVTTGRAALGIARVQAMHRRVAVGDLFAESPPIQELVPTDDPHGLVDSFLYGVSLSRIAHPVPDSGQLYVMPSGTEPPDYEEILPNPRWIRLTAGFREVKALLILAVPASAPHVDKLVAATDGAVLIGNAVPPQLPVSSVIASLRAPRGHTPPTPAPPIVIPTPPRAVQPTKARPKPKPAKRHISTPELAGIALFAIVTALVAWLAYRPFAENARTYTGRARCDSARTGKPCEQPSGAPVVVMSADSVRRDTVVDSSAVPFAGVSAPVVANPADSGLVMPFAVELMSANTQAGAILKLQKDGKILPAATFSPAIVQGARWFKVVSGAYSDSAGAVALLADLRRRGQLLGGENVVKVPFAFFVDSVPAAAVPGMVASYVDRGQPVYALRQPNGSAWLLIGAFESIEQASLYMESLRASGMPPTLVYRKGRPF